MCFSINVPLFSKFIAKKTHQSIVISIDYILYLLEQKMIRLQAYFFPLYEMIQNNEFFIQGVECLPQIYMGNRINISRIPIFIEQYIIKIRRQQQTHVFKFNVHCLYSFSLATLGAIRSNSDLSSHMFFIYDLQANFTDEAHKNKNHCRLHCGVESYTIHIHFSIRYDARLYIIRSPLDYRDGVRRLGVSRRSLRQPILSGRQSQTATHAHSQRMLQSTEVRWVAYFKYIQAR